jgi:hypothetical protein
MSIFVCSDILIITGLENPTSSVNEIEVRNQSKIVRINKIMRLSPFGSDVLRPFSGIFVVCVCLCVCRTRHVSFEFPSSLTILHVIISGYSEMTSRFLPPVLGVNTVRGRHDLSGRTLICHFPLEFYQLQKQF